MNKIKTAAALALVGAAVAAAPTQASSITNWNRCTVNVKAAIKHAPGGYSNLREPMYCRFLGRIGRTQYTLWAFRGTTVHATTRYTGQVRIKKFTCPSSRGQYACYDGKVIAFFGHKD